MQHSVTDLFLQAQHKDQFTVWKAKRLSQHGNWALLKGADFFVMSMEGCHDNDFRFLFCYMMSGKKDNHSIDSQYVANCLI